MKPYLHTVGVVVQDMPATLAFYRALGLEIPAGEDHGPHVEYVAESGYAIGFVAEAMVRQSDPQWRDSFGHPSYQAPWDAFWGQRFARVIDPNQNVVNLFAHLEK